MARPLRVEYPGAVYHIISRGIEGKEILSSDIEKKRLLKILSEAKAVYKIELYLYCLMKNHYHIVIETLLGNISQVMHWINGTYTNWYNNRHQRKGHLFQGRYKGIVVDKDEYLLELSRYIHLNPVKAGIVKLPEGYQWSSYRAYLESEDSKLVKIDFILNQMGRDAASARKHHRDFVMAGIEEDVDLMNKVAKGFILGRDEFIKKIEERVKGINEDDEIPQLRIMKKRLSIDEFYEKLERNNIDFRTRGAQFNITRDVILYLCKRLTLCTNREVGAKFGLSDTAVSYIWKKINKNMNTDMIKNEMDRIAKVCGLET